MPIIPFYQDALTTIYHGDCLDILPYLPKADLIVSDPPYGVDYVGKTKKALKIQNDSKGHDGTRGLVADAMRMAPLRAGGAYYLFSPSGDMLPAFLEGLSDAGLPMRQILIWVKDVFVMGRQDYHWRHEAILYGWREGGAHAFYGGRTQDTVWEVARPFRSREHPTMKPLGVVDRAIWNSSKQGDLVLDMFLGSGTTLEAARALGRRGIGIEIDERYAEKAALRLSQMPLGLDLNLDHSSNSVIVNDDLVLEPETEQMGLW
jgi:DNA modification methylase